MTKLLSLVLSVELLLAASAPSQAQFAPQIIKRGKKATALVDVTFPGGKGNGSAFCIDKSGLFVTNSHVVSRTSGGKGQVHVVIDSGLETHRNLAAKVLRADDVFDLALLKVEAGAELTPLELGNEEMLVETAPIVTFGFPFGRELSGKDNADPEMTVLTGRITSLKRPKGRLEAIQFDGQLNPGNSGGPVIDDTGRVIGVAVATVRGAAINMAIPIGHLSEFLTAPGVIFEPPPLNFTDRAQPVTWKITVQPSTPGAKLPDGLAVNVTVVNGERDRRSFNAKRVGDGVYEVQVTPVPKDQPTPTQVVDATVEAKQGSKVLATVQRRTELKGQPPPRMVATRIGGRVVLVPAQPRTRTINPRAPNDDGMVDIQGVLDVDGVPRGAAKTIRPPNAVMGDARVSFGSSADGEIRRFAGHTNGIWSVAISPDGHLVLTASHDVTVRLWDFETGRQLRVFQGHSDHVKAVAFLPDGIRGLSGADDDTLRLWDLKTGRELRQFVGHAADVSSLAVSPDGRRALSGAIDHTARLWDLETGRELRKFTEHSGSLNGVAFLPDGHRAVFAGQDGTVRLWELDDDREQRRFDARPAKIHCVAASPDGRRILAGGDDGVVRIWEVESGREVGRLAKHDDTVICVGFTPEGRGALSGGTGKDSTVRISDLESGRGVQRLPGFNGDLRSLALTSDGRGVVLALGDGTAQLWRIPERDATPKILGTGAPLVNKLDGKISDIAVGGGGRFLCLSLKDKHELAAFDANEANIVKTISLPSDNFLVAAGASSFFIVFPDDRIVQRWDIATMTRQGEAIPLPIKGRLKGLAMGSDSDGPLVAVWWVELNGGVFQQSRFSFIDPNTLKVLKSGPITTGGFQGIGGVSSSGGSFILHPFMQDRVHIRASAGSDLFGIWQTGSSPSGFQTLSIRKGALRAVYNHFTFDHLSPGPDGLTIYTGRGGVLDADGKPAGGTASSHPQTTSELNIPSPDPAYYLSVQGLSDNRNPRPRTGSPASSLSASVHAACDGARLLSVTELDEMGTSGTNESSIADDFTVDKRFHLIPRANLLITIPYSNDRLVLRRLDIGQALDQLGSENLVVTSPSTLFAEVGKPLSHQIEARSKAGGFRYEVTRRLAGMTVSTTGMLTWLPESTAAVGDSFPATVRIIDSKGQIRIHELKIRVSEAKTH